MYEHSICEHWCTIIICVMFVCLVLLFQHHSAVVHHLSLMDTSLDVYSLIVPAMSLIFATLTMSLLEVMRKEDVFPVVLGQVLHHIAHGIPPLLRLQQIQVLLKNKEHDSTNIFQVVKHVSHSR